MSEQSPPDATLERSLTIVKLLFFLFYAALTFPFIFLNLYYKEIGLTGTQIGQAAAVVPLVSIVASPVWGVLNDRFGRSGQCSLACRGT